MIRLLALVIITLAVIAAWRLHVAAAAWSVDLPIPPHFDDTDWLHEVAG